MIPTEGEKPGTLAHDVCTVLNLKFVEKGRRAEIRVGVEVAFLVSGLIGSG